MGASFALVSMPLEKEKDLFLVGLRDLGPHHMFMYAAC
jgi:hypothetical protein